MKNLMLGKISLCFVQEFVKITMESSIQDVV
jgi:hypothetical protein